MSTAVDPQTAIADVERWLDFKRIRRNKREEHAKAIDDISSGIEEGLITIDDDCNLVQKLIWPIEADNGSGTAQLKWQSRVTSKQLGQRMKGVDISNGIKSTDAIIAGVTGEAIGIIEKLDTSTDKSLANSIAVFFL